MSDRATNSELIDWAERAGVMQPSMEDSMLRAIVDELVELRARLDRVREYIDDMPRRHRQEWATSSGGTQGDWRRHGEQDALWRVKRILEGKEP